MKKYVVIDLEMCQVPRSQRKYFNYGMEIIEIGAVMMDESFRILKNFQKYVCPKYGHITPEITRLTGIKKVTLSGAGDLKDALSDFNAWIGDEEVTFVSWSITDRKQLQKEIKEKAIGTFPSTSMEEAWEDSQALFAEKVNRKKKFALQEALVAADIKTEGKAHDALDDAYNTALLYKKLKQETELALNTYYESSFREEQHTLCFSLGDLLGSLSVKEPLPAYQG